MIKDALIIMFLFSILLLAAGIVAHVICDAMDNNYLHYDHDTTTKEF